jgi:hypothetical protein
MPRALNRIEKCILRLYFENNFLQSLALEIPAGPLSKVPLKISNIKDILPKNIKIAFILIIYFLKGEFMNPFSFFLNVI